VRFDRLRAAGHADAVLTAEGRGGLGPLPLTTEERAEADQSDQGVTVTVVLEALQLLASSVSTTVFGASAQASRK
jgi:hypothetical protein